MAARPLSADDYVSVAIEALETDIAPALSPDLARRLHDVISALAIARQDIRAGESEMPHWALLDALYDDGDGSLDQLARDIRTGTISSRTRPTLVADLRRLLEAEIKITHP